MNRRALQVVLLLAGRGVRLGGALPKCLTELRPGQTILDRQLLCLEGISDRPVIGVVGYRKELIVRAHPALRPVENHRYAQTNTAVSLRLALAEIEATDVLWLNGDVVFDRRIIPLVIAAGRSCMAVNKAKCGAEEIKYTTNGEGIITAVSKQVQHGEGEAVGINLIKAEDLQLFKACLAECDDLDYFERGLELAIGRGLRLYPLDIGALPCVEVDFPEDLETARQLVVEGSVL